MKATNLHAVYDELGQSPFDPGGFEGVPGEVVFEIMSADTFIAGIASSLLDGVVLQPSYRSILDREFLASEHWILEDGREVNLGPFPELHAQACLLERLRRECLRFLGN